MHIETEEEHGIPPAVMTAEFITPDGKRYNFEQIALTAGLDITLSNESGDEVVLRFWENRQSDKDYPIDKKESAHYEHHTLPKVSEKTSDKKSRTKYERVCESAKWFIRDVIYICRS